MERWSGTRILESDIESQPQPLLSPVILGKVMSRLHASVSPSVQWNTSNNYLIALLGSLIQVKQFGKYSVNGAIILTIS